MVVSLLYYYSNTSIPYIRYHYVANNLDVMTSVKLPIPIDPDKTYPIVWRSGGATVIRELPGYYLLASTNSKAYLYTLQNGGQRKVETVSGVTINTPAF